MVGNQATPIPVTLDGADPHDRAAAGGDRGGGEGAASGYKLQITPATTLYTPQRSAGAVTFGRIEISLPIVG